VTLSVSLSLFLDERWIHAHDDSDDDDDDGTPWVPLVHAQTQQRMTKKR
jgi:hypothetical protein